MSPILGILASQNYPRINGAYESIATTTVSTSVSSITFSSIPATYTHLQLRWIARSDRAAAQDFVDIRLNSDRG